MTVVNTATGEIIEPLTRDEAERLSMRISLKLDAMADAYTGVMPLIREAVSRGAHSALGYPSVGAYVADRFGGALSKLGVDMRREVVRELTEAGMSTRAIAPVVGVSHTHVQRDLHAGGTKVPPATTDSPVGEAARADDPAGPGAPAGEATDAPDAADRGDTAPRAPRPPVTGLDGKTYTRPELKARRKPLTDAADNAGWDLRRATERLERIAADDRFAANTEQVAPLLRNHLNHAIEVCQDLLSRIDT